MTGRWKMTVVIEANGCWRWTGYVDRFGYGRVNGKSAHRVVYEALVGPIPTGLEIDHLCRNRGCVNPKHLEPVTHAENVRRSPFMNLTYCRNGHLYEPNTYRRSDDKGRDCRACNAAACRRYRARKKERLATPRG